LLELGKPVIHPGFYLKAQKPFHFLLFLALLITAAALIQRTQAYPVNAQNPQAPRETIITAASATPTNTAEPSATPDPQSSQTPVVEATATATTTPTATATIAATPPSEYTGYLPILSDSPPPSPAGCIPLPHIPAYSLSAETELASLLNDFRVSEAETALNVIPQLTNAARRHALDMAENDLDGHIGSDDSGVGDRASDACYEWLHIGQAWGSNESAESMLNSWMLPSANRDLILSDEFVDFGIAYFYDEDTLFQHYWVVVLGRPVSAGQYIE
jgi:uncharacterized protein YkwD